MASLCPVEQDVRAARRNMVPFIYTHSQVERGERDRDSKKQKETKTASLSMESEKMRGEGRV